jgi:hypothetical protein
MKSHRISALVLLLAAPAAAQELEEIKLTGVAGTVDAAAAQKQLAAKAGAFEACFTDHVQEQRYVGGRATLRFRVKPDGAIRWVQLAAGDLGAWPVEKCLRTAAAELKLAPPKGGEAEFRFSIDLPPSADTQREEGGVDPKKLAVLKGCGKQPAHVQVTLYVGPGGQVTSAGFGTDDNAVVSEKWADCAHGKLTALKLRDPRGVVVKTQGVWKK